MASAIEENLRCPVCHDLFQDPVIMECSHSFCRSCWQRCRKHSPTPQCPLCKRKSYAQNPPVNLALKNLSEAFSLERSRRSLMESTALCSLHSEKLGLFCWDDQQPVCVVCSHSKLHANHNFSPVDEAAEECRNYLRERLKPLQEERRLLTERKNHFDKTTMEVESQAQDLERQIKDVFAQLKKFLEKEEQDRLAALRTEKQVKTQQIQRKIEALSRELADLSGTMSSAEKLLDCENVQFLQSYRATAERVQPSVPQIDKLTTGDLIDAEKHVTNLAFTVSDRMKDMVDQTFYNIPPPPSLPPPIYLPQVNVNVARNAKVPPKPVYGKTIKRRSLFPWQ